MTERMYPMTHTPHDIVRERLDLFLGIVTGSWVVTSYQVDPERLSAQFNAGLWRRVSRQDAVFAMQTTYIFRPLQPQDV